MTISHIKLPLRNVPPTFYMSLYVVLKENHRGICSARVVPMAKISAIGSPPIPALMIMIPFRNTLLTMQIWSYKVHMSVGSIGINWLFLHALLKVETGKLKKIKNETIVGLSYILCRLPINHKII